jgi:hypothetical protein
VGRAACQRNATDAASIVFNSGVNLKPLPYARVTGDPAELQHPGTLTRNALSKEVALPWFRASLRPRLKQSKPSIGLQTPLKTNQFPRAVPKLRSPASWRSQEYFLFLTRRIRLCKRHLRLSSMVPPAGFMRGVCDGESRGWDSCPTSHTTAPAILFVCSERFGVRWDACPNRSHGRKRNGRNQR